MSIPIPEQIRSLCQFPVGDAQRLRLLDVAKELEEQSAGKTLEQMMLEMAAKSNCCELIQWLSDGWECVVVHHKGEPHRIYRASTPHGAVVQAYRDR